MQKQEQFRALQLALIMYVVILAMKLAVYMTSGVMALLAEAMHTLTDVFVSGFLLVAAIFARRGPDETHMFGHGRAENAAALVAATLFISFTSLRLYEEAVPRLFRAEEASYQNLPLVIGVLGFSMVLAGAPLLGLLRQTNVGAAAKAQAMELINDELGLLAALLGTILIIWGQPLADPIATILVATIIAYNGIRLFLESLSFLLGRSPGPDYLAEVEARARAVPGVLGVHGLRAEFVGPDTVQAGLHIVVRRGTPIEEADRIAREVQSAIHRDMAPGYCTVHVDASP